MGVLFPLLLALTGFVPGLMYLRVGLKTLRKGMVAVATFDLVVPVLVHCVLLGLSTALYMVESGPGGSPYVVFEGCFVYLVLLALGLLVGGLLLLLVFGRTIVLNTDIREVSGVVHRMLEHEGLEHKREGDVFEVGDGDAFVSLYSRARRRPVIVRVSARDGDLGERLRERLGTMFGGRDDGRAHPLLASAGVAVIVLWSVVLVVVLAT